MLLDTAYRWSFYLTLSLACCCLAMAEVHFFPLFPVALPMVFGLFALAWNKEGEWLIGESVANYLGIVIAIVAAGWILFYMPQTEEEIIAAGVPWPAGLLPHLGPLLLVLLVVKLYRPKNLPDFWVIQTMGLMMVALGCILASQSSYGVLLMLYALSLVWCLSLHYLAREQRRGSHAAGPLFPAAVGVAIPWRWLGVPQAARWLVVAGGLAFLLFLATPRSDNARWDPTRLTTGAPARTGRVGVEFGMDLNRVGWLELSHDIAFRVGVTDRDKKPIGLNQSVRWRVDVLDHYQKGRWRPWQQSQDNLTGNRGLVSSPKEVRADTSLAPADGIHLAFEVKPAQTGGLVLAEPIDVMLTGFDARVGDGAPKLDLFFDLQGSDVLIPYVTATGRKQIYRYRQIIDPARIGEPVRSRYVAPRYRNDIASQGVPEKIGEWTRGLLRRLPALKGVELEWEEDNSLLPRYHEKVAQAICDYFAHSAEYRYTLDLGRSDTTLDPLVDFLINVKSGHCERFAGALVLVLRSLRIPARIVRGYRGCEPDEEGGYLVRQDSAHSWVEVYVEKNSDKYWITFDPTPEGDAVAVVQTTWSEWLHELWSDGRSFWKKMVVDYNPEMQQTLWRAFWRGIAQSSWVVKTTVAVVLFGLGLTTWVVWRRLRRRDGSRSAAASASEFPAYYRTFLRIVAKRLALVPAGGQTPLEFALQVAKRLKPHAATAAWAAFPGRLAESLYRERFGQRPISASEQAALAQELRSFKRALALVPRGG